MADTETASIVALQTQLLNRLRDLGYPDSPSAEKLSRQLAHVSVLGRNFSEHTLPLFLSIAPQHQDSIAQLSVSLKCDLEDIRDSLIDMEQDLQALMQFLNRR